MVTGEAFWGGWVGVRGWSDAPLVILLSICLYDSAADGSYGGSVASSFSWQAARSRGAEFAADRLPFVMLRGRPVPVGGVFSKNPTAQPHQATGNTTSSGGTQEKTALTMRPGSDLGAALCPPPPPPAFVKGMSDEHIVIYFTNPYLRYAS